MIRMSANQPVNIKVLSIGKGIKPGFADLLIQFDNYPEKSYPYRRKASWDGCGNGFVIISGCRVTFDRNYNLLRVTREYDTKGKYRKSTEGLSGKIRKEIEHKGLSFPDVELPKEVEQESDKKIEEVTKESEPPKVETPKGKIRHPKYSQIMTCIELGIPVYLAGPAGSGKNHTVEQIAKELGWEFYFSNSVQQEYKLTGFIDAGGDYHETEFYKACTSEEECVFFLDEMDASIPDVLVLLNAAIANGYFEFPTGRVDFDNVHFVAAGNTVGNGADDKYTGRMVLDSATLDRFAIIEFDYDRNVELKLTKGNVELVDFITDLRKIIQSKGIRHTLSYRCLIMATKLEKAGMPIDKIMKICILKGMDKDTINTLSLFGTSKYYEALRSLQR
jgi:hypothetical protein